MVLKPLVSFNRTGSNGTYLFYSLSFSLFLSLFLHAIGKARVAVSLSGQKQFTDFQKTSKDPNKPVSWGDTFKYDIIQPTDHLVVNLIKSTGSGDKIVEKNIGRVSIALNHLPTYED